MVPGISSTQPTNHPFGSGLMMVWYRCFMGGIVNKCFAQRQGKLYSASSRIREKIVVSFTSRAPVGYDFHPSARTRADHFVCHDARRTQLLVDVGYRRHGYDPRSKPAGRSGKPASAPPVL